MSCDCAQCKQHYRTLGIAYGIPTEAEVEEAYREGVKQWHPDLYENYASLRADAEEHFKLIQVAYRELKAHSGGAVEEAPAVNVSSYSNPKASSPASNNPVDSFYTPSRSVEEAPALSFNGAPGCLVSAQFTEELKEMVDEHLGKLGSALAIVDLSGSRMRSVPSHFFLLAASGIMMRDARNLVSLLWYRDMGEVSLGEKAKQGLWQKLGGNSGGRSESTLQIHRDNGTLFASIGPQVDDSAKRAIYNFLLSKK